MCKTLDLNLKPKEPAATKKMDIPDCAVCLQTCVHPVELPCSHVFCFLCMKGASTQYRRCALCRQEIPVDFFMSPKLLLNQDDEEEVEDEVEECYTWFYEGRNGWWQYDERTDAELEESYRANKRTFELLIAGYVYVIDLDSMLQYRRSDPSRRRRIKRDLVSAAKKGIAGLKIKVKRDEDSADRRVVGAEEDKENGGAVGGATAPPEDNGMVKDKDECPQDRTVPCEKEGVESDESIQGKRAVSPNANHSNSAGNEAVYEVVRNASPRTSRTGEESSPTFRYTNPSPSSNTAPPTYAKPIRQRRRHANDPSPSGASSQTVADAQEDSSLAQQLTINHQRTHSAPESRPSSRPRGPAPQAPPRDQSSYQATSSTVAQRTDSNVERVTETLRSELVINVGSNVDTSSSGARRRQVRRHVHEV
ncbi:E3 ubiquitin-protein ligase RNF146-B-like isoform X2 [Lytechinus variegatus]|uniref:E3 ubiquitin-protein ligase RNF146-B-like isoform X2 n=1 Tax=Lytechinus variegatus TaxID=7654 RepID=UPI001BB0ECC6|nr:E3 ubiquitin-protein ligase RNF146-B-like isoform X2 [Lytechinus variegatus]